MEGKNLILSFVEHINWSVFGTFSSYSPDRCFAIRVLCYRPRTCEPASAIIMNRMYVPTWSDPNKSNRNMKTGGCGMAGYYVCNVRIRRHRRKLQGISTRLDLCHDGRIQQYRLKWQRAQPPTPGTPISCETRVTSISVYMSLFGTPFHL